MTTTLPTHDPTTALTLVLREQTRLLRQILAKLDAPQLGLHDGAGAMRIYANRSNGCLWYTVTDGAVIPISQTALTAYLTDISFPKLERRGRETVKMQAFFQGDRPYVLEAGHDSNFSKGFLSAIAQLTSTQLQHPITIAPQAGSDDSVLFCRVFAQGELIRGLYGEETDWRTVARAAIAAVRGDNPQTRGPLDSV